MSLKASKEVRDMDHFNQLIEASTNRLSVRFQSVISKKMVAYKAVPELLKKGEKIMFFHCVPMSPQKKSKQKKRKRLEAISISSSEGENGSDFPRYPKEYQYVKPPIGSFQYPINESLKYQIGDNDEKSDKINRTKSVLSACVSSNTFGPLRVNHIIDSRESDEPFSHVIIRTRPTETTKESVYQFQITFPILPETANIEIVLLKCDQITGETVNNSHPVVVPNTIFREYVLPVSASIRSNEQGLIVPEPSA